MADSIYEILESRVDDLATLPGVAVQLIELCADPEVRIGDLASLVEADPAISSRLLRLANSAFYGRPTAVSTIKEAVMVLGLESIRALTLSIAVFSVFQGFAVKREKENSALWQHAIGTALCAREIARRVGIRDRERAFVSGLLHDVGQIVLAQCVPEKYDPLLNSLTVSKVSLEQAERDAFGTDHAEIGGWLMAKWRFPAELRMPVAMHHLNDSLKANDQITAIARSVQVANWLATIQGLPSPWAREWPVTVPACRVNIALDDEALVQLCLGLDKRVTQVCSALGLVSVSSDVFQRALYRANRSLAQMAVDLDARNRSLQRSLLNISSLQRLSSVLAASDGVETVAESFARGMCQESIFTYVQATVPISANTLIVGSAERNSDGTVSASSESMNAEEWLASASARRSPLYLRSNYCLLNGATGEVMARMSEENTITDNGNLLAPYLEVFALAVERALAHRDVAAMSERLRNQVVGEVTEKATAEANPTVENQRLRMLGEMSAGVAHDLNNALAIILGQAQLGAIAEDLDEAQQYFRAIETSARDCANTVRRLQEFARGTPKEHKTDVIDLADLVRETVKITRPRWRDEAQKSGAYIDVIVDVPNNLPITGDAASLREVLTNLIFNAIDAMPDGGTIAMRAWAENDQARLAIRDTGVGISQEAKESIFKPFFTTKGERGNGLGLVTSKRIIEEHNGQITVHSRPGAGTTFLIVLPLETARPLVQKASSVASANRSLHLLVIDDEPQVREVLTRMLRLDGHITETAATGREGISIFAEHSYDLVLTDIGLPDMQGWQVVRTIRAVNPEMPIVVVTGWTEEERATGQSDVDAVLVKPFGISDLRRAVAKALERKKRNAGAI